MEYLALKAPVDIAYLGSRMVEKGYNRSTLARKIGVNRNTIRRWLNGEVRYALMKNILRMSEVLECTIGDLVHREAFTSFDDASAKYQAARKIDEGNLESVLTLTGEFAFLEEIVRAVLTPELPGDLMGRLYNVLAFATMNQNNEREAYQYACLGRDLALKFGDSQALFKSRSILTSLESEGEESPIPAPRHSADAPPSDLDRN